MTYQMFIKFYNAALSHESTESYLDAWTDCGLSGAESKTLPLIYKLARMSVRELRKYTGETQKHFAEVYEIPLRTIQDWELGKRNIAEYTLKLLAYTVFINAIEEGSI